MYRYTVAIRQYVDRFHPVAWTLILGELLEAVGRNLVRPYLALYLYRQGADLGVIGFVLAAGPVANLIVGLLGGSLADRYGRRRLLVLGTFGGALALLGFGLVSSPAALGLLHFLNTAARSLYRPANFAAMADVVPGQLRGEAFGLRRVARNVGAVIGPPLGFWFFLYIPQLGFLAAGLVTLLMGVLILLRVPETGPINPGAVQTAGELGLWRTVLSDRALLLFILSGVAFKACERFFDSYLPVVLQGRVDPWLFPVLLVLNGLLVIVLQIPVNTRLTRHGLGALLGVGGLLCAAAWAGFALPLGAPLALFLTVALTVGETLYKAATALFVPEIAPVELRGRYEGAANLAEAGAALIPVLAGLLLSSIGSVLIFLPVASVALVAGLLGWWADCATSRDPDLQNNATSF